MSAEVAAPGGTRPVWRIVEHGPRAALAADPGSRFRALLDGVTVGSAGALAASGGTYVG